MTVLIKDLQDLGIRIRPLHWEDSSVSGEESKTPVGTYYIWPGFDGDWHWSLNSNVAMGRCRDRLQAQIACEDHITSIILQLLQRE